MIAIFASARSAAAYRSLAAFCRATARSAQLCAEQEQLLDELLADELTTLVSGDGALAITPLQAMSAVRRAALLRRWLARHGR